MRVLWIVNTIFPYPAQKLGLSKNVFGGWLNGLADSLKKEKNIEMCIATMYDGKELKEYNDGTISYYLLPGGISIHYNKNIEKYWLEIYNKFKPDLVHIHGTEYPHGLAFQRACPIAKTIVSIQGLVFRYADVYLANIDKEKIYKNITLRDILKKDTILQGKKKFELRGIYEKEIICNAYAILGRTDWDYSNCKAIDNNMRYYKSNEILRGIFYQKEWDINNIERETIYISQASYPIKGFHYFLEALKILKIEYPNLKVYIGGNNIIQNLSIKQKFRLNGYAKYILNFMKMNDLFKNIEFLGLLSEDQVVARMLKTHVFVLPSAIENSSNSLGEAMILGMPCVATNTGGTMDMLEHKKEGFLYPYTEPAMLANYISLLFENDELAITLGKNAKKTALNRHDKQKNAERIIEIYKKIMEDKNE